MFCKLFHYSTATCILLHFILLLLFLKTPTTTVAWDNSQPECPYPCLPPPTSVTNCPPPPPPPPTSPSASYPPPSTPAGYSWNYPPPPPGYYYPYFPPPNYVNFPAAPPPPNPILPWFPWYYKSPPSASMASPPPLDKSALTKSVIISCLPLIMTLCFI